MSDEKDLQNKVDELTKENEELFEQLLLVQEELEKYYLKLKEQQQQQTFPANSSQPGAVFKLGVDESEFKKACKAKEEAEAYLAVEKFVHNAEKENSIQSRIWKIISNAVDGKASIIGLPFSLRAFWKEAESQAAPSSLGGAEYKKVIEAYAANGETGVEKLLDGAKLSFVQRANAYTALARAKKDSDKKVCEKYAAKAYQIDPRPYRLKWYALRVAASGDLIRAKHLLSFLPEGIKMSDWEKKETGQINNKYGKEIEKRVESNPALRSAESAAKKEIETVRKKASDQESAARKEIESLRKKVSDKEKELSASSSKQGELERKAKTLADENAKLKTKQTELERVIASHSDETAALKAKQVELERFAGTVAKNLLEKLGF